MIVGIIVAQGCVRTPEAQLHRAAQRGDAGEVERLLSAGVPVSTRDGWSSTALMYAASHCQLEVVTLLVSKGADINEHRGLRMGRTPAMWAAQAGCADVLSWLKQTGADLSLRDREGATAADLARRNGHNTVASLADVTR